MTSPEERFQSCTAVLFKTCVTLS